MSEDAFLIEARAIGDHLARTAFWHRGRCTWLTRPVLAREAGAPQMPTLTPLGASVYGGTAGVALFLGRLAKLSGDAQHRRTAMGALDHALHHTDAAHASRFGFHGGALGVAWTAHELAGRLDEPALDAEARRIVRALGHDVPAAHHYDLTYGNAGAIPLLLRLAADGFTGADALAGALADDLLGAATKGPGGALSWDVPAVAGMRFPQHLAGFSHGASGMGLAFAHMYRATGEERHREAALAAFRYERQAAYDDAARDWADLRRSSGQRSFQGRWCHGAAGIGMARALAKPLLKDPTLLDEMRVARAATLVSLRASLENPGEDTTLCCGMGGLVESLWAMDAALGAPGPALETARAIGAHQAARFGVKAQERWPAFVAWPTLVAGGAYPGLMQGVAGIGNLYLRLHTGGAIGTPLAPPAPNDAR